MEYSIGEYVVFGLHGVCELMGTQTDEKGRNESYVLQPLADPRCRLFVPVDNEIACRKMRRLITKEEAERIMDAAAEVEDIWIFNENMRKDRYLYLLKNGERTEILQVIKTLHHHQDKQRQNGKRLHRIDEKNFKDAKKILYGEISLVTGIPVEEVEVIVAEKF